MRNSSFFTNKLYPTTSDVIGGPMLASNIVSSSIKHFGNGGLNLSAFTQSGIFTNQQIVWGGSSWVPNVSSSNSTANTFTGINKFIGGLYADFYQMTGSVIDVTKAGNLYTNTASTSTVSYSISNPTESYCTFFRINSSSIDRTITIPSTYSVARGGIITTLYIPSGMILHSKLQYLSARWEIINDPIDFTGSGSLVFNSGSAISLDNAYGLKLTTGVTGFLGVSNGGTNSGTASNAIQSLTTPAQTISASFINWATGSVHKKTLSAHTTFSFNNSVDGQSIKVFVTNTAGNYGVAWPSVFWPEGIVPTQTTGDYTDLYTFRRFGSNFFGRVKQNYSAVVTASATSFMTDASPTGDSRGGSYWVGCRITVGGAGLTVTDLRRWGVSGNSNNHLVRIYRVSDNAIMASATVTAAGATWASASSSGTLAASTQYYLVSDETAGLENWSDAYIGGTPQLRAHTSVATIDGLIYSGDGVSWNFTALTDASYGPADFKYT